MFEHLRVHYYYFACDVINFISETKNTSAEVDRKFDPAKEQCTLNVKIADLGNACWTVSVVRTYCASLFIPLTLSLPQVDISVPTLPCPGPVIGRYTYSVSEICFCHATRSLHVSKNFVGCQLKGKL